MTRLFTAITIVCFAFTCQAKLSAQSTQSAKFLPAKSDSKKVHSRATGLATIRLAEPPIQIDPIQKFDPIQELSTAPRQSALSNSETKKYPYLFTKPADREWIKSLPIHERPNRPFHVYGNAVRDGLLPHGPIGQLVFGK